MKEAEAGLKPSEFCRKELEQEYGKLNRLLAESMHDNLALKDLLSRK